MFWQSTLLFSLSLFCFYLLLAQVSGKYGSIMFGAKSGQEHIVSSENCSGVFFKPAALEYECACITGVWGFYELYCKKPVAFLGGDNHCFGLNFTKKLVQVALFGNDRDPFESSISHFQKENFVQLTVTISENEYHKHNYLEVDALGSWITVTNSKWTLYGDGGEAVCLLPTVTGRRVFCTYNIRLLLVLETMKWNNIIRVEKGCLSNVTVKADACYPFRRPNDKYNCNKPPIMTPCPDPENETDINPADTFCYENINIAITTTTIKPVKPPPTTTTPTTTPIKPLCGEMTREVVKRYWLDPVNNQCAKSLNEALLTDQLRRFATTRFDKVFDERLQSLDQMKQLIIHSRDIMKKTCLDDYVPKEFFDVATEAFLMFINEDFFYGVEGIDQISFDRVLGSLKKCWKRAKGFVYESKQLGCDLKKITGSLILPAEKVTITIPENAKSKRFEPLIETAWKMFLNAHSYCFEDFQISNDHHHFSVLFLELFSRTIYEKWIEPLTNKGLYKFIVPKFDVMKEIMENIDYCVAATGHVSQCPVWLVRSNPLAKPILDSLDIPSSLEESNNQDDSATSISGNTIPVPRKKRSTWARGIDNEKTRIWDGSAYCVHNMIDPSRLGLATCTEAF